MTYPEMPSDSPEDQYQRFLTERMLFFQRCQACGHPWLPARSWCPNCLEERWAWEPASGRAHLISWVVYHRVLDPAYQDRVPYNVAIVELEEGPRLISNLLDVADYGLLSMDMALQLKISGAPPRPLFALASTDLPKSP